MTMTMNGSVSNKADPRSTKPALKLIDKIQERRSRDLPPDLSTRDQKLDKVLSINSIQLTSNSPRLDYRHRAGDKIVQRQTDSSPEPPETPHSVGCVSPWGSEGSEHEPEETVDTGHTTSLQGDVKTGSSVKETNLRMLQHAVAADVLILLNQERLPLQAHSYILRSRSGLLAAPLVRQEHVRQKTLTILDVHVTSFLKLIKFLYTDECRLKSIEEAAHLLPLAIRCGAPALVSYIYQYLVRITTNDNVCTICELAHANNNTRLVSRCIHYIIYNAGKVLKTKHVGDLCGSCLERVVNSNDIQTDELSVYKAVECWAEAECTRQGLELTVNHFRQVLGKILYLVRFPMIDKLTIGRDMSVFKLLTQDEQISLYQFYNGRVRALPRNFINVQRTHHHFNKFSASDDATRSNKSSPASVSCASNYSGSPSNSSQSSKPQSTTSETSLSDTETAQRYVVQRFAGVTGPWWMKQVEKVTFRCSNPVNLRGIQMFGRYGKGREYPFNVTVICAGSQLLSEDKWTGADNVKPKDVLFRQMVLVPADTDVEVQVRLLYETELETYIGVEGARTMTVQEVTFSFLEHGDDATRGQIPGLLFSKSLNHRFYNSDV